jgi:soluble lytic murein transglycosylase
VTSRILFRLLLLFVVPSLAAGQQGRTAVQRAESLHAAGRPWHAAETLLAAASREPHQNAAFVVQSASAELRARRYDRARSLLAGQPWLDDYGDGEALGILAEAEARLGAPALAAMHFVAACGRASGSRAALLAVRAGLAFEAAGAPDSAARYYAIARATGAGTAGGLATIDAWLRVRQARVTRDTAVASRLLADLPPEVAREAPAARARALLAAGDSAAALEALARTGHLLDAARLALARHDTVRARAALYELIGRAPESDDAAAGVALASSGLPPRLPAERVALARTLRLHGDVTAARIQVARAVGQGDSSAATLVLYGELLTAAGRLDDAARAYRAAAGDSALRPLALYRRARVLLRLGDLGAPEALSAFAQTYPADTAAPTALYLVGDLFEGRGDWTGAARWFGELLLRYPADLRASNARFRLAARATDEGRPDSAARLYQAEADAGGPQRNAARFWLGRLARERGDSANARDLWTALAREDSIGYYGLRARREVALPPLRIADAPATPVPPLVAAQLGAFDTLILAGLDTEAQAEVRWVLVHPPQETDALLAWSARLVEAGWGPAGVRLGWHAAARTPNDPRSLRAIFPWPDRAALEPEAREFGVDPMLFVGIVRQESTFDLEALSAAGARGLAQLLPGTAARTARSLDVTFYPEWITVPDLNLHLGAAHFADLLHRYGGRVEVAVAAYNAGPVPVARWLARPGADDPDRFIELIPYPETRGYVRAVLRNRELYRALYGAASQNN